MPLPPTKSRRLRRVLRVAGINLLVLAVLIVAVELALGSWLYGPEFGVLNVGVNTLIRETDSTYYPAGTEVIYRRDAFGLRGDYGAPEDITILAVGGSTTNDSVVSEGDTWPEVLEADLRAKGYDHQVANAGVDGHSTFGHIKSFELWFPNIPGLHPDYAIVYVGHNDRGVEPGTVPQPDTLASPSWSRRLHDYVANHSVIVRAYKNLLGWLAARRIDVAYRDVDTDPATVRFVPMREIDLDDAALGALLDAYRRRLGILDQKIRAFGAIPVYVTQPVGLVRTGEGGLEVVEGSRAGRIYQEMRYYNAELLAFCAETGAICIDLAGELEFELGDFYDAIHTTPSGSRKIGAYLAEKWPLDVE